MHTGYVFLTTEGTYVRRTEIHTHTGTRFAFVNTDLNGATLFPCSKAPSDSKNQDWSLIKNGRSGIIPIKAVVTRTVELKP